MSIAVRSVFLAWILVLAACPGRQTRHTLVPDVPTSGDATARTRFQDARAKFLRDGKDSGEFRRIVEDYPADPIVPFAQLYAGISDVKAHKLTSAVKALNEVIETKADPGLTARAKLFLGIVKNYQGDAAGALELLRNGERAVEDDSDRTEYLAALAYATAAAGNPPIRSLAVFDQLYPRVTPTEQAAIVARIEEVVARAEPDQVRRAFDEVPDRKGPSFAVLAGRLVEIAERAGNAAEAKRMRDLAGPARIALGLPRGGAQAVAAPANVGVLGAVVPLGGKSNRVGEAAVAGLGLAAGVGDGKAVAAIEVRAAGDEAAIGAAIEGLARGNVVAIIGPTDRDAVDAAGPRADALGVPLISLSGRAEKHAPLRAVFHIMHSGEARSRALARRALAKGITRFAVLAPDSGYGKALSAAFSDEVGKAGGSIVSSVTYKPDTKSFVATVDKLSGSWDAVFIPEDATTLALIAPALDASSTKPRPIGTKKIKGGGRPIVLMSTAENLSGAFLVDAGRHAEGALLAPGYYPDDQDPASKAFVDRFIQTYGRAPGFVEAYAFDAAQLAAAAGGEGGRSGLAAGLAKAQFVGLTGTIRFDADHRRADPGVVYTVVEENGSYAIRIAK
ncbi:MAG TPA: penicillin-binding protein activator [Kofleriaceae bacterium]|nr:penicillin-binding protein activator [Kofleriaceae bacterium]